MSKSKVQLKKGDYVLAIKWHDGDSKDPFVVGFYDRSYDHFGSTRHLVVDNTGQQFRANGFRRVEKISQARGEFIVRNMDTIESGSRSVWWWKRTPMKEYHNNSDKRVT